MKKAIKALIPAFVLALTAIAILTIPTSNQILPPSMSPDLPLNGELEGWYGERRQESERERLILAKDTRFSKADYSQLKRVPWAKSTPPIHVSLVFSGSDLNNSIHRPERCLPAQGHINLVPNVQRILLADGREVTFTRLGSVLPHKELPDGKLYFIHYYVFVGKGQITHNHIYRTLLDIKDRALFGREQSWAYFQAGTYWSPHLDISEQEADRTLQQLISQLLPRIIRWDEVEG